MASRSRLSIAKTDIVEALEKHSSKVFTHTDLAKLLAENRRFWRLAISTTTNSFIEFLLKSTHLQLHQFNLPHRPTNRYSWGDVSTLELVQSLQPNGYFTHYTALELHGLTEQSPKTVYLNFEQQATGGGGELTQGGIDRAFKGKCRVSQNVAEFRNQKICILNGRNTGLLGVEEIEIDPGVAVKAASIERTLIDIAVRPIYSGGVFEVARAYEEAHSRFSVNKLASYLRKMNYTYPYHQAVGYYLERSGKYTDTEISLLRRFKRDFDFYLTYNMKETDYVERWRLFVPKGF